MSRLHLVFASGTIFTEDGEIREGSEVFLRSCIENNYECIFMTHSTSKAKIYSEELTNIIGEEITFYSRADVRAVFSKNKSEKSLKTTIVIGANDNDLYLAANYKLLFLYPTWDEKNQETASKYGFHIDDFNSLVQCLKIIENQTKFYYNLQIDEKTTLYALTSANNNIATQSESEIINKFRKVLKNGQRSDFQPLFFHLISSIMKNDDLRKIDIWGIMPSSSLNINQDMYEIKERCRYLTGKRMKDQIFIRHTAVNKSHETGHSDRLSQGATKHLESIKINPVYKGKLRGKTVCILDDYVTNGPSFESLRNLLLHAGVEKIYFFAFGRFKKGELGIYQKEDYEITGDIYSANYKYKLVDINSDFGVNGLYDHSARHEVENIRNILS